MDDTGSDTGANGLSHLPVRVRRPGERRSLSRSATRALDVLEVFGRVRRPLRAVEIAKALSLHPSTTDQLLKTMVESAHLTFDAVSKSYLPSLRLARFSAWIVESHGTDPALLEMVLRVQRETGEVVTLTTPNDLFMQVVDSLSPPPVAEHERAERGLRVSIFGSATGTAYLSTLPDGEVTRLADRARLKEADLPSLFAELAGVRACGVADCSSSEGMWSIAAPVSGAAFSAPLVLGLAGPANRIQPKLESLRHLLRTASGAMMGNG